MKIILIISISLIISLTNLYGQAEKTVSLKTATGNIEGS